MTTYYGKFNSDNLLTGVFQDPGAGDIQTLGLVEIPGWTGWVTRPSEKHALRHAAGSFAWEDPRTIEQARLEHWDVIKAAREAAEAAGFTWDGSMFDSDAASHARIQGAALLAVISAGAALPFSIDWTLADNAVRSLTGEQMIAVGQALAVHVATQHATGRTLRTAIEAATTVPDVEAVQWPV